MRAHARLSRACFEGTYTPVQGAIKVQVPHFLAPEQRRQVGVVAGCLKQLCVADLLQSEVCRGQRGLRLQGRGERGQPRVAGPLEIRVLSS